MVEDDEDDLAGSDETGGDGDSSDEDMVDVELKCGVQGCISKDTVWRSATRLAEHRLVLKECYCVQLEFGLDVYILHWLWAKD